MNQLPSTRLHFMSGSSDKIYEASVYPSDKLGNTYQVQFAYGRRGGTLRRGTKTNKSVGVEEAIKCYQKLVKAKISKGYCVTGDSPTSIDFAQNDVKTIGENFVPFENAQKAKEVLIGLQLLNPVNDNEYEKLLNDDAYGLMEKMDGHRRAVIVKNGKVIGVNRRGEKTELRRSIGKELLNIAESFGDFTVDGEIIDNKYYAFDLLSFRGVDCRNEDTATRYSLLRLCLQSAKTNNIKLVEMFVGSKSKNDATQKIEAAKGEGVVLKKLDAPYQAGQPSSGGTQLKYKFYADATVRVKNHHPTKRSVYMEIKQEDEWRDIGKCTIPVNKDIPGVGVLIDVRYLYAYPNKGSLYQPTYKGVREDKNNSDQHNTLKFKSEVN